MKILTVKQMRRADEYTIGTLGVPSLELMERAGRALAREAEAMIGLNGKRIRERALVVCGGGNNGGDGFVCARVLLSRGQEADVVLVAEKTSAECAENKARFLEAGGKIVKDMPQSGYALVVDCLLGTGFHGALSAPLRNAVEGIAALKANGAKVLSADIPSGVHGDNGRVEGAAVVADKTLCIGEIKAGTYLGDGIDCAGEILREDIGIALPEDGYAVLLDDALVSGLLPVRKRNTHKGSYGKAAIVAGSAAYTGAAYLATAACLRAGAGYTALFTPAGILPYYMLKAPEALLAPICAGDSFRFDEAVMRGLLGYQSVAYGMGLGASEEVAKGAEYLVRRYEGKLILDADAINALAAYRKEELGAIFKAKKCDVLLTPHIKEFSRLSGKTTEQVCDEGLFAATDLAKEHGVCTLLKNAVTTVTDGERIFVNAAGTSGQAKGGSGDVLSGVLASLCACGLPCLEAACAGAYVTGKAAFLAAEKCGEDSLTASDTIGYLGEAFKSIRKYG